MLADVGNYLLGGHLASSDPSYLLQLLFLFFVVATTTLLSWRIWRFTMYPLLYPEEPREVLYWIPFSGHALAFLKNPKEFLSYGREYFKRTREPFAITLGREKLYILTFRKDVVAAHKNSTTVDYGNVVQDLMARFGVSRLGVDTVYAPNPEFVGGYSPTEIRTIRACST